MRIAKTVRDRVPDGVYFQLLTMGRASLPGGSRTGSRVSPQAAGHFALWLSRGVGRKELGRRSGGVTSVWRRTKGGSSSCR
jgi:hypothetical protein